MKKLFIIPGYGESAGSARYRKLITTASQKGYSVQKVPIQWKYRVMSDYISQFEKYYTKHKTVNDYFLGFSFGAVIAFSTAQELQPKKIFLCSLSNAFKEDIKGKQTKLEKFLGKRATKDLQTRSAKRIAKSLTVPTVIFYGEKEKDLKKRCEETAKLAKKALVVIVKNADHEISLPEYIQSIKKYL